MDTMSYLLGKNASGEGSNFGLNVTSYEIKQNGVQDFYRLVMTQED